MVRKSKKIMEADAKKIIDLLQKEGNISVEALAKKAGFSRQKTWRTKTSLEKNQTIYGYHAIIDRKKLNLRKYFILVRRSMKPMDEKVLSYFTKDELQRRAEKNGIQVESVYFVNGAYDFLFSIIAASLNEVKKFQWELVNAFKHISTIHILEELVTIKEDSVLHPENEEIKEFF